MLKTYQGIQLLLETISKISGKIFVFVSLINRCPSVLKQTYKKTHYAREEITGFYFP